ncbi:MAG: transporter ATP-binding protein [Chloroflexi bacterium]|nr:transporter ATP-binding protein [Chloroflexota bacterium]
MSVEVSNLKKSFGSTRAADDLSFTLPTGAFLALLGPSGSGKTTVLRMLAGLETPDAGRIAIHGRAVFDGRRSVPPEQREIGMVFQDYALWPHMTVAQNVSFGLSLRRMRKPDVAKRVAESLAMVHLDGLDNRYPDQLSGGQQQRVAIARALAIRPPLMLLDEPLSNLDASLREEMRTELVRLVKEQGITAIYVTHDRIEALAMSDQIVVMRQGRLAQMGTPEELYHRPANPFIASFLGAANFVPGSASGTTAGQAVVRNGDLALRCVAQNPVAGPAVAVLRPEDGTLHSSPPSIEGNMLQGHVVHSEFLGGRWRHVVSVTGELTIQLLTSDRAPSAQVWVHFPIDRCLVLSADEQTAVQPIASSIEHQARLVGV